MPIEILTGVCSLSALKKTLTLPAFTTKLKLSPPVSAAPIGGVGVAGSGVAVAVGGTGVTVGKAIPRAGKLSKPVLLPALLARLLFPVPLVVGGPYPITRAGRGLAVGAGVDVACAATEVVATPLDAGLVGVAVTGKLTEVVVGLGVAIAVGSAGANVAVGITGTVVAGNVGITGV